MEESNTRNLKPCKNTDESFVFWQFGAENTDNGSVNPKRTQKGLHIPTRDLHSRPGPGSQKWRKMETSPRSIAKT